MGCELTGLPGRPLSPFSHAHTSGCALGHCSWQGTMEIQLFIKLHYHHTTGILSDAIIYKE